LNKNNCAKRTRRGSGTSLC